MKKSILILAMAALAFSACTKSEGVAPVATTPTITTLAKNDQSLKVSDDNLPKHSGADDPAKHNANDDKLPKHSGADDPAKHNANDDKLPKHSGADDPTKHNANDDNLPKHSGNDGSKHK